MKFVSLLVGLTALAGVALAEPEYTPVLSTKLGDIRGVVKSHENHKIYLYEGIKYGVAERWAVAKPAGGWSGVYNATKFQYACTQSSIPVRNYVARTPEFALQTGSSGEDCLYVNVWTPSTPSHSHKHKRAVMAWIHGGSFSSGTIFSTMGYDARMLALEDVVVVTINYRLGSLGFMYGGTPDAPGNLGLHDQILALQWIQENIESFGGDKHRVTVFGESAGSMSVGALVLSPLAKGLFIRAIQQSGAPNSFLGSESREVSFEKTKALAEHLNCTNSDNAKQLACMRAVDVNTIVSFMGMNALLNGEAFWPIYGDELMPHRPVEALKTGKVNHVDLMFGTTRNEGSGFVSQILPALHPGADTSKLTVQQVKTMIKFMFMLFKETKTEEIVEYYTKHLTNETDKDLLRMAVSDAFGDYHLVCPTILFGETFAKATRSNSHYAYRLMMPSSMPIMGCRGWMGVCHAEDILYMFGFPVRMEGLVFTPAETKLSRDMLRAWTTFAKEGHPGKMDHVKWHQALEHPHKNAPQFVNFMALDSQYEMVDHYYADKCDAFWRPKIFE